MTGMFAKETFVHFKALELYLVLIFVSQIPINKSSLHKSLKFTFFFKSKQ